MITIKNILLFILFLILLGLTAMAIRNDASVSISELQSISALFISICIFKFLRFLYRRFLFHKSYLTEEEIQEKNLNRRELELNLYEKELKEKENRIFETEQKKKGLAKFIGKDLQEKWGTPEQVKKWKEMEVGLTSNFFSMGPHEFEEFIGKLFEKMGYRNVKITPKTGDYGIDVVAEKGNSRYAIQVKRWKNVVGNEVIQNTLGSMSKYHATRAMVITNSRFTKQAIEQARSDKRIELLDKDKLHSAVRKYFI